MYFEMLDNVRGTETNKINFVVHCYLEKNKVLVVSAWGCEVKVLNDRVLSLTEQCKCSMWVNAGARK